MSRPQLSSKRSWTGNHVLLPSYSGESRMMDQEVFNTPSQTSFASWSLGRYTVVMSRPKSHSVPVSLISAPKSSGRFGRQCSSTRSSPQVQEAAHDLAFLYHSPSTSCRIHIAQDGVRPFNTQRANNRLGAFLPPACRFAVPLSPACAMVVGSCHRLRDFISGFERVS